MASIIKTPRQDAPPTGELFNLTDLAGAADDYTIRRQQLADDLLESARQQAEAIREQALLAGRTAAGEQAAEQIAAEVSQAIAAVVPALECAVAEFHAARESCLARNQQDVVRLALAMAGCVLRSELAADPTIPLELAREALACSAASAQARLCLHPVDLELLRPQLEALLAGSGRTATVQLIADPQITRGGCLLETRDGTIDQQFESQLARIAEELDPRS